MIYFLGDTHLGAWCHPDARVQERRLVQWLEEVAPSALAIYFMGDIFDYWFEYKYVVPRGYTRFLGTLAKMADSGVELHMLAGNHDVWMKDYFAKEFGAKIYHRPLVTELLGRTFRFSHGDYECKYFSRGQRILYHTFRSPFLQKLYGALHPGLTMPFALNWSYKNRQRHFAQEKQQGERTDAAYRLLYPQEEWLYRASVELEKEYPRVQTFIYGHRHLLVQHPLPRGAEMIIAGDWLQHPSYVSWDGDRLLLHRSPSL